MLDAASSLRSLSVLTSLREASLSGVRVLSTAYRPAVFPGAVLPSIAKLTCLDLFHPGGFEDVHCIASLSNLSVFRIIWPLRSSIRLAPDTTPFALPASMQTLELSSTRDNEDLVFDPSVLSCATNLTELRMRAVVLTCDASTTTGSALLAAVARLLSLKKLTLELPLDVVWPESPAAFTALSASTLLEELEVQGCEFPEGAWQQVFSGRVLPALRSLSAIETEEEAVVLYWGWGIVSNLVRCAPHLRHLELEVFAGPAVAALTVLTQLSSLTLDIEDDADAEYVESVHSIATLTNLCELELAICGEGAGYDLSALLPLTQLTNLTRLKAQEPIKTIQVSN